MLANVMGAGPREISILIAEDSATQSEHLRSLLERNGFSVLSACNGKEALSLAASLRPAVIISDVMMPEMDGYDLCRSLKRDPLLKGIPAILVTELSSPQEVFKGLEAGADCFLVKPYEASVLVARIGYLLVNQRLRSAQKPSGDLEVEAAGMRHLVTADRPQILDLLISTYDQAGALNDKLEGRRKELAHLQKTLAALSGLAAGLKSARTEAEVAAIAIERTMRLPGVRAGWIELLKNETFTVIGRPQASAAKAAGSAGGTACSCRRMLLAGDLTAPRAVETCERLTDGGSVRSARGHISIPLIIDGKPAGILNLIGAGAGGQFPGGDLSVLAAVGDQIADALERVRLKAAMERKVEERTRALAVEVAERTKVEQAARAKHERLVEALDALRDGIAVYDADERLVLCNRRYRETHAGLEGLLAPGAKLEALVRAGLSCAEPSLGRPAEPEVAARLARLRRAEGNAVVRRRGEHWVMATERRTPDGGLIAIETDITELKKVDEAKDEFLAKVSHELRTPLTSIRGATSLLLADKLGVLPPGLRQFVELAQRNSERLMCIVNDLLDVTRIRAGNFHLDLEEAQLEPIIEQVLAGKRLGAEVPNIKVRVAANAKGVTFMADAHRIQQVLDNLLTNAVKFADAKDPIDIKVERRDDALRVSVVDRGCGIPAEFQSEIFEPFAQAPSGQAKGGNGLGLSIAKTIIEAHHGRVGFASKEGQGATFYFDLPIAKESRAAVEPARKRRHKEKSRA